MDDNMFLGMGVSNVDAMHNLLKNELRLNWEPKGLIKAIPVGPGTRSLKLWTQTQNQQVLDFENMPLDPELEGLAY